MTEFTLNDMLHVLHSCQAQLLIYQKQIRTSDCDEARAYWSGQAEDITAVMRKVQAALADRIRRAS